MKKVVDKVETRLNTEYFNPGTMFWSNDPIYLGNKSKVDTGIYGVYEGCYYLHLRLMPGAASEKLLNGSLIPRATKAHIVILVSVLRFILLIVLLINKYW